jgi:hypothetical protein
MEELELKKHGLKVKYSTYVAENTCILIRIFRLCQKSFLVCYKCFLYFRQRDLAMA